jgi:hypothetical protein
MGDRCRFSTASVNPHRPIENPTMPRPHGVAVPPVRLIEQLWVRGAGSKHKGSAASPPHLTPFHDPSLAHPGLHVSVPGIPENVNVIGLPSGGLQSAAQEPALSEAAASE